MSARGRRAAFVPISPPVAGSGGVQLQIDLAFYFLPRGPGQWVLLVLQPAWPPSFLTSLSLCVPTLPDKRGSAGCSAAGLLGLTKVIAIIDVPLLIINVNESTKQ